MRRTRQALFVLMATLLVGVGGSAVARDKEKASHHRTFPECAKACYDCARVCDECAAHCAYLVREGHKEHFQTLATCADCATVCRAAGAITARGGPFSVNICKACADVCKKCGEACMAHKEDEMMRKCAEECFRCEKACREMIKHAEHLGKKKG